MGKEQLYLELSESVGIFSQVFFENEMPQEAPDFHWEIYDLLPNSDRVVIAAPRGFAKSTIVSKFFPLWAVLFKKRKDICIISASETLATEHLRFIKTQLESNQEIKALWGDLRSEKWTETHIIAQHPDGTKINVRAKGAGGQIRGFRPDCIILDDIETDESVESEEQRKKLKDWLFKACLNTLLPGGQLILIGTVIHPLCVLADLLDTPNGWVKKRYKAYVDGIEEKGHELWAEARPHEWLQARKQDIGSHRFSSEFMNDPKSDESAPIKEDQIRYWESLPPTLSLVITVDPAYSEEETADFKVCSLVGIDQLLNRYLVNYVRTHEGQAEFMDSILSMWMQNKNQITNIGIPNKGTEKSFYDSFVKHAEGRKLYPPVMPLENVFHSQTGGAIRNKKNRIIAALQPLFEQGKYYINANHYEAREELLTIGYSRWDDLVDTMAYAEQILTPSFMEDKSFQSNTPSMSGKSADYGISY